MKRPFWQEDLDPIAAALRRIKPYLDLTPTQYCPSLSQLLGHQIYFKIESLQETGAFKVRGALNHLLALLENDSLPAKVSTYSTGNHGIGVAWAAHKLGINARVYLPEYASLAKGAQAAAYGAQIIYTSSRQEAEERAYKDIEEGFYYLPPSGLQGTIEGVATVCYEAVQQMGSIRPDAIFAPCGSGGLLAGCYLTKQALELQCLLIGAEPINANDAYHSIKSGSIFRFTHSPATIADGLKALSVSELTYPYLRKLDEIYLIEEKDIKYWTVWVTHLLKVPCEPSSAVGMAAAALWLRQQSSARTVLIIISGGNIDPATWHTLQRGNWLELKPQEWLKNK